MKTKYTPLIAMDYTDGSNRYTCFQLCRHRAHGGQLESVADVYVQNGEVVRNRSIIALSHRARAIARLALRYTARSIPQNVTARD